MSRYKWGVWLCVGAALATMYLSTITRPAPAKPLGTVVMQGCIPAQAYEEDLDRHHKKPVYSHGVEASEFMALYNALPPPSAHRATMLRFDTYFHMAQLLVGVVGMSGKCVVFHNALTMELFLQVYAEAKKKARGDVL